jgi:hypothetical protein
MYASIRRTTARAGSTGEATRRIEESFVALLSRVPGLLAYYVVDTGDNNLVTVSIFEDQAGAEESRRLAVGWVKDSLASILSSPVEVVSGEVVVHKVPETS